MRSGLEEDVLPTLIRINPDEAVFQAELGWNSYHAGKLDAAAQAFGEMAQLDPRYRYVAYHRCWIRSIHKWECYTKR